MNLQLSALAYLSQQEITGVPGVTSSDGHVGRLVGDSCLQFYRI